MLMTCFGVCLLRIAWVMFILPRAWSIDTVVMNYPVTWSITTLLFIGYYLHGGWLRRRIKKSGYSLET